MTDDNDDKPMLGDFMAQSFAKARKDLGVTQPDLAEILTYRTGYSVEAKSIYRWEKGLAPVPAWVMTQIDLFRKEFQQNNPNVISKKAAIKQKEAIGDRIYQKIKDKMKNGL